MAGDVRGESLHCNKNTARTTATDGLFGWCRVFSSARVKMRAASITFISLVLTSAVVGNAFYHKKQFYPSVVYITKSNPSMAVGVTFILVIVDYVKIENNQFVVKAYLSPL